MSVCPLSVLVCVCLTHGSRQLGSRRVDVRTIFEVNVLGTVSVIQRFLPLLRQHSSNGRAGMIVNVSSGLGMLALPTQAAYSASKFAIEGLSDALRRELHKVGAIPPPTPAVVAWCAASYV